MLDFEVNEAHYPPNNEVPYVVPSEFETYASKPWKKIIIGNMSLFSETTSMRLRMIHQPGSEGIELKEIEFMRMN